MATRSRTADATPDEVLAKAEQLVRRQSFDAAVRLLAALEQQGEAGRDALYLLAVSYRMLGRPGQALEILERLRGVAPDYGRCWQEIGHNHRDQGRPEQAAGAYAHAVELNPGLLASWRFLAQARRELGQGEAARVAESNFRRLKLLPRELVSVTSMMHEGRLHKAERLCRHFLQQNPHHLEGMRLLAAIGTRLHIYDDAEFLLESALELAPDFDLARMDFVKVLHKRQKFERAWREAQKLRERLPGNPGAEMSYANQCSAVGRYEEALEVLDALLDRVASPANVQMQRGHSLKTVGRQSEAVEAYRSAAAARPELGDAWWSLANLKTFRFSDDDIEQMRRREAAPGLSPVDRYHFCFALGKALEDRGEFEQAFAFYQRGNALKNAEVDYSADRMQADFDRQKAFFTPERVRSLRGGGVPDADPVFIVGLPRAGSTLIEQILASHSQVDGTLELPNILAIAHRLGGRRQRGETPRYPAVLADMDAARLAELGRQYLDETRIHRQEAPHFTDKMPNNFRHIGLILSILPNARIIDARREAMACCFSGYKQLFAEGQEFSYSLADIGRYYSGYVDLMAHWRRCYPDSILQVDYEDVVDDLEGQVRGMLEFLGLSFEPACVEFHRTERSVRTASSEQVRQPINRRGVEQWRNFEPWLDELRRVLADGGVA